MRFWTTLVSLVLACLVTSSLFAQGGGQKRGARMAVAFDDAAKDGKLDMACYTTFVLSKVTDETKKDAAKTRAERTFKALAKAAGAADDDAQAKYVFSSKDDYDKAVTAMRASFKNKKKAAPAADATK